jgi:hypothetical protein
VPELLGLVSSVAVVVGIRLLVSDVRQHRRVVRQHPSAASTTVADEVEKWLRDRG